MVGGSHGEGSASDAFFFFFFFVVVVVVVNWSNLCNLVVC